MRRFISFIAYYLGLCIGCHIRRRIFGSPLGKCKVCEQVEINNMCRHFMPKEDCVYCGPNQGRVYIATCPICGGGDTGIRTYHADDTGKCLICGSK